MEHLKAHESADFIQQNPEAKKEAISKETDRLFGVLESPDMEVDDLNSLLDRLSSNPLFRDELEAFQDYNSTALENVLIANMEAEECVEWDLLDYFWVRAEFTEISRELEAVWLDLWELLSDYRGFIETKLTWLDEVFVEKVKSSITTRLKEVSSIIEDLKNIEIQRFWSLENFNENRWIINEKVWEHLSFINNELLPSLQAYSKIKWWANVPEKFTSRFDTTNWMTNWNIPQNPNYINVEYKIWEIEELMTAHLDSEWNFDEWLFSTQSIFNTEKESHRELLSELGVQEFEISLLNEKDKQIQDEATLYFMAMIWVQIWVETLGWVVWNIVWGWIDVYDSFSSEEELLNIAKNLGLADKEFRMDKTWVDNVLAGVWLIPWATQAIKWPRLASFMEKVDAKTFENAVSKVKEQVWLWKTFSEDEQVRLSLAENLLWRELDRSEKSVIIEAHNLWEKVEWEYSYSDIKEKYMVLKESGFDEWEIRTLMEKWITWKETKELGNIDIIWGIEAEKLYDRHPSLENYQDIFLPNDKVRVLWEWTKWFVLSNERLNFVWKIPISSEVFPILLGEIEKHQKFYDMVMLLKGMWKIPEWVKVPSVKDEIKSDNLLLAMEKVNWNSLTTYRYKEFYKDLPWFKEEIIGWLTDYEIKLLLEHKYNVNKWELDSMVMEVGASLQKFFPDKLEWYNTAIKFLKERWLEHKDLHSWNIMIDTEWNLYLIDFDTSNFSK